MDFTSDNDFSNALSEYLPDMNQISNKKSGDHYEIVSKVAYLLGIPKRIFDNEHEPPMIDYYNELNKEKKARIIRNLCSARTLLERNFKRICIGIQQEGKSIMSMPEYIPSSILQELYNDGIDIYKNISDPSPFLFNLNQNIKSRINNCRDFFPDWLDWDYLSNIFIMPDGMSQQGTKNAAEFYYSNMQYYPYQVYMNWPAKDEGNILYSDLRFVTLLYEWNNDEFSNKSLVSDVSENTKGNIYKFIEESDKCIFIVDCENSDPYNLCAAIRNLDAEKLSKIDKIILFDDVHAASAWQLLSSYIDIPVEYILIERLKDNKSLADMKVATRTCKEFYLNSVDSFVLVSSDSDYWGLMQELPQANFLVMVEHDKCSYALKETLINNNIFYCYIDDFYAGGGEDIKGEALKRQLSRSFKEAFNVNLNTIMHDALAKTRIEMSEDEINNFIKRKLKNQLKLEISDEGDVELIYRGCK